MATNTYVALKTTTVGTATPSVTLDNIPQGYTDLRLVMSVKDSAGYGIIRYNGDGASTGLYSRTFMSGNGFTATSNRSTNANEHYYESSTTEFAVDTIDYMNYTNTNVFKTGLARLNVAGARVDAVAYLYRSTSAISSMTITSAGGNIEAGSTFTVYGIAAATPVVAKATGGTVYYDINSGYVYHKFTSSGTFTPTSALSADILVVGGGGSGYCGGGGAGGVVGFTAQSLTTTGYTITVGQGGPGGVNTSSTGTGSQFGALTAAVGGGRGGYNDITTSSFSAGGSGGGGGGSGSITTVGGTGTAGQGFAGGTNGGFTGSPYGGGGGGGAGEAGKNATAASAPGRGGNGTNAYADWATATASGASGYFAGGGGSAGTDGSGAAGAGGLGGGAAATPGQDNPGATANTGGGGGGVNSGTYRTGNGGSGIVIVRYLG